MPNYVFFLASDFMFFPGAAIVWHVCLYTQVSVAAVGFWYFFSYTSISLGPATVWFFCNQGRHYLGTSWTNLQAKHPRILWNKFWEGQRIVSIAHIHGPHFQRVSYSVYNLHWSCILTFTERAYLAIFAHCAAPSFANLAMICAVQGRFGNHLLWVLRQMIAGSSIMCSVW